MADLIRAFIAVELDGDLRAALARVQAKLKVERAARYVRWVAPESIHVTFKFLGDFDIDQKSALESALSKACIDCHPFALTIRGIGAFPSIHRANVVWVGAEGQTDQAAQLAIRIDDACAGLGFAREGRAFSPHLTLGRVKRDVSVNDRRFIGEMIEHSDVGTLGDLRVERVSLMKSELRPSGSIYTRLSAVELEP